MYPSFILVYHGDKDDDVGFYTFGGLSDSITEPGFNEKMLNTAIDLHKKNPEIKSFHVLELKHYYSYYRDEE